MPEDAIRREVVSDLRVLRRSAGDLNEERFTGLHSLIEQLGRGSIRDTYRSFMRLNEQLGQEPGTDLHAFFFTTGIDIGGDTLDVRLKRYADTFHVVEKTALRRTDRGMDKLSHIIRDHSREFRPQAIAQLIQDRYGAKLFVSLRCARSTKHSGVRLFADGDEFDVPELVWGDLERDTELLVADLDLGIFDLRKGERGHRLISFYIKWSAAMRVSWLVQGFVADPRLSLTLEVDGGGTGAIVELWWPQKFRKFDLDSLAANPVFPLPELDAT